MESNGCEWTERVAALEAALAEEKERERRLPRRVRLWQAGTLGLAAAGVLVLNQVLPQAAVAQSQATPVRVVNSGQEPVPTAAIGKTQVAGLVGLDPQANPIRVGNGDQDPAVFRPAGGVLPVKGTVRIESSPQDPVSVCSECDRNALQVAGFVIADATAAGRERIYTVPEGKRLVIQFASADVQTTRNQGVSASIATHLGGLYAFHRLVLTKQNRTVLGDRWSASQPMQVYADPGSEVHIIVVRDVDERGRGDIASGHFTLSGYLTDL